MSTQTACAKVSNPDIFTSTHDDDIARAKAVCATCPAIKACLTAALDLNETGVWGGLTKAERAKLRRRLGRKSRARFAPTTGRPTVRKPIQHGTINGAQMHYRRGEKPCDACKEAARAKVRAQRAARRERVAS